MSLRSATVALVVSLTSPAASDAGQSVIDFWDASRGLPGNSATALAQTPEGYLWVGTYNGLARFDGIRFVTFDPFGTPALTHSRVRSLATDASGALWINTHDGSLTSWREGVFTLEWNGGEKGAGSVRVVSARPEEQIILLQSGAVMRRRRDKGPWTRWEAVTPPTAHFMDSTTTRGGDAWFRSDDERLWRLSEGRLDEIPTASLTGRVIRCLTTDGQDRVWIGTDREIAVWNGGAFENRTPENGPQAVDVPFLRFTADGGYWAVANGEMWRGHDRRWTRRLDLAREMARSLPWTIVALEDRRGGTWFAHESRGLVHVDAGGEATRLGAAEGFTNTRVKSLVVDREDNLWVSVDRGGLARVRERRFRAVSLSERADAHPAVSVSADGDGTVWIGTLGAGLARWKDGTLTSFPLHHAGQASVFAVVPGADRRLWMSADAEDLWLFEDGRARAAPWPVHGIKVLLVDRSGGVWMGRKDGLSRWSAGAVEPLGAGDGIDADVRALAEDRDGTIWVGSGNGSIHRYRNGRFEPVSTGSRTPPAPVWSLVADADGVVWAGTYQGGLLRIAGDRITRYTTREGLASDVVCQLVDDERGHLWIGSREGLLRVPKSGLAAVAEGKRATLPFSTYGRADGIPPLECSGYQPASWRARDGQLWFATTRGVVSTSPSELDDNPVPPPVAIEEVTIDGEARAVPAAPAGMNPEPVIVPAGRRQIEIRYTGLSLTAPESVRFRHRLEGLEPGWVDAGTRRITQYSYVPPGDYTFRVIACNSDGVWNERGAALAVTVLPRLWETWWFKASLVVSSLGLAAGVARHVATRKLRRNLARLERQRAIEHDRARIAKDIHDDLGAGLTQISLLSELLRSDSPQEARTHVEQIAETAADLTKAMDEIVWAVNPSDDTLDSLWSYLGHFAQEYLGTAGIQCRLETPETLPGLPVTAEVRHNVFLAVKEALHNVVKHAGATEVHLRLETEPASFRIEILDDGRGLGGGIRRTDGRAGSGQGLKNLADRMASIGGAFEILENPGGGARLSLSVSVG